MDPTSESGCFSDEDLPASETKVFRLRGELFNAFNHPNWGDPGVGLAVPQRQRGDVYQRAIREMHQIGLKFLF